MKKLPSIIALLSLCTLFNSCNAKKTVDEGKLRVVAANFVSYDFARTICGDSANLKLLIKPGTEIHSFDPSPMDIINMENADLFIFTGGESDEWAQKLLSSMKNPPKKLFLLTQNARVLEEELVEGMESDDDDTEDESDYEIDEHVWTSPANAITLINALCQELCAISPENTAAFTANAAAYTEQIAQIQSRIKALVASKEKPFIVMGDRFPLRYFTEEFGIEYRAAFPGCSSAVEASTATIAYLIDTVKNENLPAVFTIELSNQKIAKAIASATGASVIELNACHNLTKAQFDAGFTYAQSLLQNEKALSQGLR